MLDANIVYQKYSTKLKATKEVIASPDTRDKLREAISVSQTICLKIASSPSAPRNDKYALSTFYKTFKIEAKFKNSVYKHVN